MLSLRCLVPITVQTEHIDLTVQNVGEHIFLLYDASSWDVYATGHYKPYIVKTYTHHGIYLHALHMTHTHPITPLHWTLHNKL